MKDKPKILSTQRLCPAGGRVTQSKPKLEISWKELSPMLKSIDSQTPRSWTPSEDARGNSASTSSRKDSIGKHEDKHSIMRQKNQDGRTLTNVASASITVSSPSTPNAHRRSLYRNLSFSSSSSRKTRILQAQAARKVLDLITPDVFAISQEVLESPDPGQQPMAADSPPQIRMPYPRNASSNSYRKIPFKSPAAALNNGSRKSWNRPFGSMTPPRHPNSAPKVLQCTSME